jgi:nucleoside 2-deoxyribosyltransferase
VYLAAAMTNRNAAFEVLQELLEALRAQGHEVLTPHVADPRGKERDACLAAEEIARRDLEWLAAAHCLLAEVSTPSHGVGAEVMAAWQLGKPVLLLAREAVPVSRFLLGLSGVRFARYRESAEAVEAALAFLRSSVGKAGEGQVAEA